MPRIIIDINETKDNRKNSFGVLMESTGFPSVKNIEEFDKLSFIKKQSLVFYNYIINAIDSFTKLDHIKTAKKSFDNKATNDAVNAGFIEDETLTKDINKLGDINDE